MRKHRRRGRRGPDTQADLDGLADIPALQAAAKCGEAGKVMPQIDRNRCEAKDDCVRVCPYNVFEIRRIEPADFADLTFKGKVRSLLHGRMTAYTPAADACRACGLCVKVCPEDAIRLVKNPRRHELAAPGAADEAATVSSLP